MKFRLEVTGTAMRDGNFERLGIGSVKCEVKQSDWATILEQIQYRCLLLIELDACGGSHSANFVAVLDAVAT
ncbi:hypothetical protein [Streptomyces phaeochromogenes]|uniref:hypothetical protein n=1 Tax=Streptomyces phaeochromogenes TaxID=1923 RepID=UPI003867BC10|nr:hypothetical protein OG277_08645 [Streptomyces phaeochromogenes]